jgi:hypothetical protein
LIGCHVVEDPRLLDEHVERYEGLRPFVIEGLGNKPQEVLHGSGRRLACSPRSRMGVCE